MQVFFCGEKGDLYEKTVRSKVFPQMEKNHLVNPAVHEIHTFNFCTSLISYFSSL